MADFLDASGVSAAITELIKNAVKHSASDNVDVQAIRTQTDLHFTVKDWGIGMFNSIMQKKRLASTAEAVQRLLKRRPAIAAEPAGRQAVSALDAVVIAALELRLDTIRGLGDEPQQMGTMVEIVAPSCPAREEPVRDPLLEGGDDEAQDLAIGGCDVDHVEDRLHHLPAPQAPEVLPWTRWLDRSQGASRPMDGHLGSRSQHHGVRDEDLDGVGWLREEPVKVPGGPVGEHCAGTAVQEGRPRALLPGEGSGRSGVDTAVDSLPHPRSRAPRDPALGEACGFDVVAGHEPVLAGSRVEELGEITLHEMSMLRGRRGRGWSSTGLWIARPPAPHCSPTHRGRTAARSARPPAHHGLPPTCEHLRAHPQATAHRPHHSGRPATHSPRPPTHL